MRLEFLLIRYVPDVVKGEFVNFGILLREHGKPETTRVCVTNDWSRVLGLDPGADVETLTHLGFELAHRYVSALESKESLDRILLDQLSLTIQATQFQASEGGSFESRLKELMLMYVERHDRPDVRDDSLPQGWSVYPAMDSTTETF